MRTEIVVCTLFHKIPEHCYHWYEHRGLPLPECLPHNRVQSCPACCFVWHKEGDSIYVEE